MAEFNITNSQVGQLNDQGDNYIVAGNQAPVAVTHPDAQATQTTGEGNRVNVEPKQSVWAALWKKVKGWVLNLFTPKTK